MLYRKVYMKEWKSMVNKNRRPCNGVMSGISGRLHLVIDKDLLDGDPKKSGDLECEFQGWIIFSLLNRQNGLPGHPDLLCECLLGHIVHRAVDLDLILHLNPTPHIFVHNIP